MLLSGQRNRWSCCHGLQRAELYGHAKQCESYTAFDIEPRFRLLREEYNACKIIRLDEKRHNRLMEFAKDGETMLDLVDRLLDIAIAAAGKDKHKEKAAATV